MLSDVCQRTQWSAQFWARVERGAADECWPWTGSRLPSGYGRFYPAWKVGLYAHRFSWELANGRDVPEGLHVMHACDNPRCVNPAHLSVGTHSDNMRDCVDKGRHARNSMPGEAHPNHRLTAAQVVEIRDRASRGDTRLRIAEDFRVSESLVGQIVRRRAWKCVA